MLFQMVQMWYTMKKTSRMVIDLELEFSYKLWLLPCGSRSGIHVNRRERRVREVLLEKNGIVQEIWRYAVGRGHETSFVKVKYRDPQDKLVAWTHLLYFSISINVCDWSESVTLFILTSQFPLHPFAWQLKHMNREIYSNHRNSKLYVSD